MNTLVKRIGMFGLVMGVSLVGWAANPCMPIAKACMQLGFYKGGEKAGKGLVKDCVMPVVENDKNLAGLKLTIEQKAQCSALIHKKIKDRMMHHS